MAEPVPRLRVVVLSPVETEREFRQRIGENFAMAPIVHVVGYCRDITQLDTQVAEQLQRPGPLIVVINTHGRDDGSFKCGTPEDRLINPTVFIDGLPAPLGAVGGISPFRGLRALLSSGPRVASPLIFVAAQCEGLKFISRVRQLARQDLLQHPDVILHGLSAGETHSVRLCYPGVELDALRHALHLELAQFFIYTYHLIGSLNTQSPEAAIRCDKLDDL